MLNKKMYSAIMIFIMVVATIVGCGGDSASQQGQNERVLFHAFASTPYVTLDPSLEGSNGVIALTNVYETLTYWNHETGRLEPKLATEWTVSDDGMRWVFQMRDDVIFHDGTEMNAQSVVNSIHRTIELGSGFVFMWDSVRTVEATGEYEVTFELDFPAAIDLIASSTYSAFIMSDYAAQQDSDWFNAGNSGGSGPYFVEQATGDTVVLRAFPDYRGEWNENQFTHIVIREVAESSARRQLLETGEAQIASDFSSTDLNALREATDRVSIYTAETFTNVMIINNTEADFMDNVYFRRALSYAFPYHETTEHVLEGTGTQARGIIPQGLWGHGENLYQYQFDLEKAQEYIDKSGIDVSEVSLVMTYTTGFDAYTTWAQMFQSNLRSLGINMEPRAMEWDAQWNMARNTDPNDRQDMFVMMWWPEYASPMSWFQSLVRSEDEISFSLAYLNNPELDVLIDEATQNAFKNRELANENIIAIQERLIDEAAFIFLYDLNRIYAVSTNIEGMHSNPAYPMSINYYALTFTD